MEKIFVGQLATHCVGSDRYPYEVIEISDDKSHVFLREMRATATAEFDYYSHQDYTYSSFTGGVIVELTLRKDGHYRPVGAPIRERPNFVFGYARFYHDPSF